MGDNPLDLIQRAAARLEAKQQGDSAGASPRRVRDAPVQMTPESAQAEVSHPDPVRTPAAPSSVQVNLSPTTLAQNGIVLPGSGSSRTREEFRALKRHLLSQTLRSGNENSRNSGRIVLVTSARPAEGKSFTAVNLALALSYEREARVLLMDADAYRQSLMSYLGLQAESGWLDCIAEAPGDAEAYVVGTNFPGFSVLPTGKVRAEIPELMSSRNMSRLFDELVRRDPGRYIVVDALPCLTSTEPSILAGLAGQTLFVVAAHNTSREDIESSLRLLSNSPKVSLVLNKAEPMLTEQFKGYGYDYGYNG